MEEVDDARMRFSHTKAIFEQLERHEQLPSFYSPRPQRHATTAAVAAKIGADFGDVDSPPPPKGPPPVPPKPTSQSSVDEPTSGGESTHPNGKSPTSSPANTTTASSPTSSTGSNALAAATPTAAMNGAAPGSPLSQVARNFNQMASDLDRITRSPRQPPPLANPPSNSLPRIGGGIGAETKRFSNETSESRTFFMQKSTPPSANATSGTASYPYWRDPAFYSRRFGSGEEASNEQSATDDAEGRRSSDSADSVPSEPRPTEPAVAPRIFGATPQQQQQQAVSPRRVGGLPISQSGSAAVGRPAVGIDDREHPPAGLVQRRANTLQRMTQSGGTFTQSDDEDEEREAKRQRSPFSTTPVETLRGLSPEREAANRKVQFSTAPIKVFKTHGIHEYDRRNDDIDPLASSAEYELERRLDKMEIFDVELEKGPEGLGVSIIGMGVGADAGLEKLGIFIKSITPGGAVHRNGRIRVCDQIVSVDGVSLVGVSQLFAAKTLRSTGGRVVFTVGREPNLEDSEVAQLIRQSLEADDRTKRFAQQPTVEPPPTATMPRGNSSVLENVYSKVPSESPYHYGDTDESEDDRDSSAATVVPAPPLHYAPAAAAAPARRPIVPSAAAPMGGRPNGSDEAAEIRTRINALESELSDHQKKAEQMEDVLKSTRTHYFQLESKYDQARALLRNYQERERKLMEREEEHVGQLREKDDHYGTLVGQLKGRIDELEAKLDLVAKRRASVVEGELAQLKQQLALFATNNQQQQQQAPSTPKLASQAVQTSTDDLQQQRAKEVRGRRHADALPPKDPHGIVYDPMLMMRPPMSRGARHAGLTPRSIPLSAAPPHLYERFMNGMYLDDYEERYMTASQCDSPIPRVSEPASPAMPQKFLHQQRRMLFSLRKRYIHENEFWRENAEAQGLQVLQWSVDDVCQLLIHMGLDKYIPEFSVNQITGPQFLDLDGNKLKTMGIHNHSDRAIIKKKVKTFKARIERERKILEKESRQRSIKQTAAH
ncbi:PDZ and Sterile alpha motif SAM domain containing protein [Aphelenchoides fujianensis]|nr:PDZ and Sterile alpha motif SAM domain containing protein [Aphelenchoides fujianensis]